MPRESSPIHQAPDSADYRAAVEGSRGKMEANRPGLEEAAREKRLLKKRIEIPREELDKILAEAKTKIQEARKKIQGM